nr:uroporphyrinogen decarboxylase family protein [Candidatus Sigynarchaeota archaeon]
MNKQERVRNSLFRKAVDKFPVFMSATPQFMKAALGARGNTVTPANSWRYCVDLDLDVVQVGHPSFYPVRVLELTPGARYTDAWGRSHVITSFYDEFCAPFPLRPAGRLDIGAVKKRWESYVFPDLCDPAWLAGIDEIARCNEKLDDPLSIWGVINGPFEPSWQLVSDAWTEFFILARRDLDLAKDILRRVTDYCIAAGKAMIEHGANAIRIGDDYALNEGLMCAPKVWHDLIYPVHMRLVKGLKQAGGDGFAVILHSDGNITEILSWLADGGIDAINPIQPDALDFETVVETIGHRLAVTGAFDLRYFLEPWSATVQAGLEKETRRLFGIIDAFNCNGTRTGFCIGPTHQVQPGSYVSTFEAWVRIVHERNKKKIGKHS